MVDDQIFREVDEELRKERLQAIWKKYGTWIVGGVVGVVLIVGGLGIWQNWQVSQRQAAGDEFIQALKLVSKGEGEKAAKLFEKLSDDSPSGYELLARLHLAATRAKNGQTAEAEILYKKIAVDPSVDKILGDYAKLNLALLRLDGASYKETSEALGSFVTAKGTWRGTALEVIALAAMKEGKLDEAKKNFNEIIAARSLPSALKRRAQIMLDVIATRKAGG